MMPEPDRDEKPPARGRASSVRKRPEPERHPWMRKEMDEEEKVLAIGRSDANMPALLTQDTCRAGDLTDGRRGNNPS